MIMEETARHTVNTNRLTIKSHVTVMSRFKGRFLALAIPSFSVTISSR
jgi:hypothetical protein